MQADIGSVKRRTTIYFHRTETLQEQILFKGLRLNQLDSRNNKLVQSPEDSVNTPCLLISYCNESKPLGFDPEWALCSYSQPHINFIAGLGHRDLYEKTKPNQQLEKPKDVFIQKHCSVVSCHSCIFRTDLSQTSCIKLVLLPSCTNNIQIAMEVNTISLLNYSPLDQNNQPDHLTMLLKRPVHFTDSL